MPTLLDRIFGGGRNLPPNAGALRAGPNGQAQQFVETNGMAGATGDWGWIDRNMDAHQPRRQSLLDKVGIDLTNPGTAMAMQMISNGLTPSVGAPRAAFSGVAQAGNQAQEMQLRKQVADQKIAEQRAAEEQQNETRRWLMENHPDLVPFFDAGATANSIMEEVMKRQAGPEIDGEFIETPMGVMFGDKNSGTLQPANMGGANEGGLRYRPLSPEERQAYGLTNDPRPWTLDTWTGEPNLQDTTKTLVENADDPWADAMAEQGIKQYEQINARAAGALDNLQYYDALEAALQTGVRTGSLGEFEHEVRSLATAFGIDADPAKVSGGEVIRAIQNRMALMMRNPESGMGMPGAISDRDIQFLKAAQVGLTNTPQGNAKLLSIYRKIENRKLEIANLAEQYIAENGGLNAGFNQVMRDYAANNPMFDDVFQQQFTLDGEASGAGTNTETGVSWSYVE